MKTKFYMAVTIALLLSGCAPGQLERTLGIGAQNGYTDPTQALDALEGYPGPTEAAPTSPAPATTPQLPFAPPEADQAVTIGEVTEVATLNPGQIARYSVESVFPKFPYTETQTLSVIIHDSLTGVSFPLGDDQGNVEFRYLTEKYVFWTYACWPDNCTTELKYQWGLYALNFETGEDIWLGSAGLPEAHEDWVIYVTQEQGAPTISLRVRHLITGEDFELSGQLATMRGYPIQMFYAINEGRVAWVETDPTTQATVLQTYDLSARLGQKLEVLAERPRALAVSDSLIVWVDTYWQGYDLRQGSLFNVPPMPMPAELWSQSISIRVTAQGDTLQWTLDVEEGQNRFFTAQVFPTAQTPQPTPFEPATAAPVATAPTPDALPTASSEGATAVPTAPPIAYP